MKRLTAAITAALVLIAMGCVIKTKHTIDATINVNIRHIDDQADDLLDFIEADAEDSEEDKSNKSAVAPAAFSVWDAVAPIRTAYAAETELKTAATPKMKELAEKMRERNPKIAALKKKNCLGEDNRGYLALRDDVEEAKDYLKDPEKKNEAQKLLSAENEDRKALHNEIARINEGVDLIDIERVYARKRLERGEPGEIFQLPEEGEAFDKFKKTELGKKLDDKCKPKAWIVIPEKEPKPETEEKTS